MVEPDRPEPTIKIGLFIRSTEDDIGHESLGLLIQSALGVFRRIQKLPPPHHGEFVKVALKSCI